MKLREITYILKIIMRAGSRRRYTPAKFKGHLKENEVFKKKFKRNIFRYNPKKLVSEADQKPSKNLICSFF